MSQMWAYPSRLSLALCALNLATAYASETPTPADLILRNGVIHTMEAELPRVSAIAVRDGKYVYLGDEQGVEEFRGPATRVMDLAGKMAMPGINDIHSHPWQGGIKELFECNFSFTATPDEIAATLRACIDANPEAQWITGGQWTSEFFSINAINAPRAWLDQVSTDKAIYLEDDSAHHGWFNSKAMELAGLAENAPDPDGGEYLRDANGLISGVALERATYGISDAMPAWTHEQNVAGIAKAVELANGFGLTGMLEARTPLEVLPAYVDVDKAGGMTIHAVTDLQTPRGERLAPMDIAPLISASEANASPNVHSRFAKFFLDGVPTMSRSAVMLAPYTLNEQFPESTTGTLMIPVDILEADLVALDAAGFTVKIHTAGDGAVRLALDALENVRKRNGDSGLRHELAHAGYIDPDDLPRFAALNVTADLSPYLWYPRPIIESVIAAVGKRGRHYMPIKDLLDSGANVGMGSDWPSAAADMNPWPAIEAMVTRRNPFNDGNETLWVEQAITLEQALAIATIGGAKSYRLEHITGSIALGKSADLVVLNHDLFAIPAADIGDTQVDYTLFAGNVVYQRQP